MESFFFQEETARPQVQVVKVGTCAMLADCLKKIELEAESAHLKKLGLRTIRIPTHSTAPFRLVVLYYFDVRAGMFYKALINAQLFIMQKLSLCCQSESILNSVYMTRCVGGHARNRLLINAINAIHLRAIVVIRANKHIHQPCTSIEEDTTS